MTRAANGWCPMCGTLVVFKILFIYLILSLTERVAQYLGEHTCCSLRAARSRWSRSGCDFLMLQPPPPTLSFPLFIYEFLFRKNVRFTEQL